MCKEEKYQIVHEVAGLNGLPQDIADELQDEIEKSEDKDKE